MLGESNLVVFSSKLYDASFGNVKGGVAPPPVRAKEAKHGIQARVKFHDKNTHVVLVTTAHTMLAVMKIRWSLAVVTLTVSVDVECGK